jgi:hypothetical protein
MRSIGVAHPLAHKVHGGDVDRYQFGIGHIACTICWSSDGDLSSMCEQVSIISGGGFVLLSLNSETEGIRMTRKLLQIFEPRYTRVRKAARS